MADLTSLLGNAAIDPSAGIEAPVRMAGDAFKATKKGRGLAAILGLAEKGIIMTGTPYGKKVEAARQGMNQVRSDATEFGLSKLGL